MKKNGGGADDLFGVPVDKHPVWDTDGPDHECDCPGPPPRFRLPPPPRPSPFDDPECSGHSVSRLETCKAVTVIDSEYRHAPTIPSLGFVLMGVVAVAVFLFIGTFLVVLKKRKMQSSFPRKCSSQNRCDGTSANGVIYEDLSSARPRTVPFHCPPAQTAVPSIEMTDVVSYVDHAVFAPAFVCPASPALDSFNSQDLFNPVYEELSNGSEERGESNSEGMAQIAASEDEFAEDELSLGEEPDVRRRRNGKPEEPGDREVCRDLDSSDADDRSKFLANSERNSNFASCHREKGKRSCRGSHGGTRKPKTLEKRKTWKSKTPSLPSAASVDGNEFHEGFLLKRILQIYPDVTGVGLQYCRGSPGSRGSADVPPDGLAVFGATHLRRPKPEIFSTFGAMQGCGKNQSQDSSLGSDSGYSNNTSGGKPSSRPRKDFGASVAGDAILS